MPHIVIEHSKPIQQQIDIPILMKDSIQILADTELFSVSAIKARSISFESFLLDSSYTDFIHVTISVLDGRSNAHLQSISDAVFTKLKEVAPHSRVSLSVDIREMDKTTYRK